MSSESSESLPPQATSTSLNITTEDVSVNALRKNALGILGLLTLTLSGAAPMTAMLGNVPFAVAFGNGLYVPAAFLLATLILLLFSIGYAKMAQKISSVGGMYALIRQGLGAELGLAAGFASLAAYSVFEASISGIFALFAHTLLTTHFNITVPWIWLAFACVVLVGLVTVRSIKIVVGLLALILLLQCGMLLFFDIRVFQAGTGLQFNLEALNILHVSKAVGASKVGETDIAAGAAAVSIFMAFWSWVGFEMAPTYSEETRKPKKRVPLALIFSVVTLGLFYTLTSWCVISSYPTENEMLVKAVTDAGNFFLTPLQTLGEPLAAEAMSGLMLASAFACATAFHTTAARTLYSLARDGVLPKSLGRTHAGTKSPQGASVLQSLLALLWIGLFAHFLGTDAPKAQAYVGLYTQLALLGTMLLLTVQALVSLSTIVFYKKNYAHEAGLFSTLLAPLIALVAQVCLVFVLILYLETFGGTGTFGENIPKITAAILLFGFLWALLLKLLIPTRYARIGRLVFTESEA